MRKVYLSAAGLSAALVLTACGSGGSTADDPVIAPATSTAAPSTTAPPAATPTTATPTTAAPVGTVVTVAYAGGKVTGDTGRTKVKTGAPVTLRITSDSAQQVHVHGTDLEFDVQPGVPVEKTFTEPAPGIFEIELHPSARVLARLEVS